MKFGYLRPIVELEMDDPDAAHPDEIKLSFGTILKVAFKVLGGLIRRKVSFKSLRKVFKVSKQKKLKSTIKNSQKIPKISKLGWKLPMNYGHTGNYLRHQDLFRAKI